jgi:hypothetical protein
MVEFQCPGTLVGAPTGQTVVETAMVSVVTMVL